MNNTEKSELEVKNDLIYNSKVANEKNDRTVAFKEMKAHRVIGSKVMSLEDAYNLEVGLSDLTHNHTKTEYNGLKDNIALLGMNTPIELDSEGKLLDGRHRIKILSELGYDQVVYIEVETTDDTIIANFMSHEVGRNNTPIQKAILAVKLHLKYKLKPGKAQKLTGANPNYFRTIKRMMSIDSDVVDRLNDGHAYIGKNKLIITSIGLIEKDMKMRVSNPFADAVSNIPIDDWAFSSMQKEEAVKLGEFSEYISKLHNGWKMLEKLASMVPEERFMLKEHMNDLKQEAEDAPKLAYQWFQDNLGYTAISEKNFLFKTKDNEWVREHKHTLFNCSGVVNDGKYFALYEDMF